MTTPVPPSRPDADAETDTRTRLLDSGSELFIEKGFNGCGLSEILRHAGVPKGSFYHYFRSKQDFGVALIERTCAEYEAELTPMLEDPTHSPLERLRRVFEHYREECASDAPTRECLIPKLALETANLCEDMHTAVKGAYRLWADLLAGPIRAGQAIGEIRTDQDATRLADTLVMLWEGATMRMQIDGDTACLENFLTFAFDSVLRPPR